MKIRPGRGNKSAVLASKQRVQLLNFMSFGPDTVAFSAGNGKPIGQFAPRTANRSFSDGGDNHIILNVILMGRWMKTRQKGGYAMAHRRTPSYFAAVLACWLAATISSGAGSESAQTDRAEWQQDMARIKAVERSFMPGQVNDLEKYERFANEIQGRWKQRDRGYYARLMLEICGPLSSGTFPEDRRHDLAREYALSALSDPAKIPLETELELIGHVMTQTRIPGSPTGQKLADRRRKDVTVRLHAWKRLRDAIDPNWDPNEVIMSPNAVAVQMGLPISGMAPEAVKDERMRAKYEAALEENRRKIERHTEQRRLHDWLKRFPKRAEAYIIHLYSEPPFNPGELKQYLKRYGVDEEAQARISSAVEQNIKKETWKNANTP